MPDVRAPSTEVVLDLNAEWASAVLDDDDLAEEARAAVEVAIGRVAGGLAIPCRPEVRVRRGEPSVLDERWPMRLRIDGARCGYPADVFARVSSFMLGVPLPIRSVPVPTPDTQDDVPGFLGALCEEIVKLDPRPLLGREQTELLASSVAAAGGDETTSADVLVDVFRSLLAVGVALPPSEAVAWLRGREPVEIAEQLVDDGSADAVEIHLPRSYLEQLTQRDDKDASSVPYLRDAMLSELGIPLPPFRFVPTADMQERRFAFKINDILMTPWLGLRPDQLLVNATPLEGLRGDAAANPASSTENLLVDARQVAELERKGLMFWDSFEYLVLCVAATTRLFGSRLVNTGLLEARAAELELFFPALVGAALDSDRSRAEITRLLRSLAAEGISIGNVKLILDAVVEHRARLGSTADDEWGLLEYVRTRLKRQVRKRVAGDADVVVAYLLDPAIEALLASEARDDDVDRLLSAIWGEIRTLPPNTVVPAVLTSADVRPHLRRWIAGDLPGMAVVSEDELPTATNVQPVARLALA